MSVTIPPTIALPDGGVVRGFYRLPDGGIGGEWPELGDPDGPPDEDWSPDAGIVACAAGWRRLPDGTCDPMLRTDCPEGSGALPGGICTPTALEDCPAGEYAELGAEAVGARVVHVRAGATAAGADGSVERPYATIAAGVRRAGNGGWVRVAAGEYPEQLAVGGGANVHVVGVCAARVTLRRNGPDGSTVAVAGLGTAVDLRGATITGAVRGIQVGLGASLRMAAVVVADNFGIGVFVDSGARVDMAACVIRGTRRRAENSEGNGLWVQAGASVRAVGAVVADNTSSGVAALDSARVELSASVVRGTLPRADGTFGHGLEVERGASLWATGVVVEGNSEVGCRAGGANTEMEVRASVVRGTLPRADGTLGSGLEVLEGATLRVADLLVDGNTEHGLAANGVGTRAEVRTSVVRGARSPRAGTSSRGLTAGGGAAVSAIGVRLIGCTASGLQANGVGTQVVVSASVVRGTRPVSDGTRGSGVQASGGATLRATGLLVAENTGPSLLVTDQGTLVELSASVVRGSQARPNGFGYGVVVQLGATLRACGVLVAHSVAVGVHVNSARTLAELNACAVRDTRLHRSGVYGRGVEVAPGATLRASNLLVADSPEVGVFVYSGDARLDDVLVVGVSPSARGFGVGLYAGQGARVEGSRMAVQAVGGAGVLAQADRGTAGSPITVRDLFVRGVRSSTVRFSESGSTLTPDGRSVAYGLHAGLGCTIDATRATLDGGGFGFYNAGGAVRVRQGVITGQLDAAGARDLLTPASRVTLDDVALRDNISSAVVQRDDLPAASSLPELPPVQDDL